MDILCLDGEYLENNLRWASVLNLCCIQHKILRNDLTATRCSECYDFDRLIKSKFDYAGMWERGVREAINKKLKGTLGKFPTVVSKCRKIGSSYWFCRQNNFRSVAPLDWVPILVSRKRWKLIKSDRRRLNYKNVPKEGLKHEMAYVIHLMDLMDMQIVIYLKWKYNSWDIPVLMNIIIDFNEWLTCIARQNIFIQAQIWYGHEIKQKILMNWNLFEWISLWEGCHQTKTSRLYPSEGKAYSCDN